ncbi:hypothetical protein GLAREA_09206 [Glarea lozoyensis ATCC 20868]|uniref:2EXR domain-containing protein n=1 Tax=Glarea lozoyensis (strain ATCC 20868 / MF5171) TaxID=1116229 RepID=S3EFS7_GLAL2|nr:uncharacterized protein GLAREA_09206 [Glarea lozoyensis ATCC 20868]EPE37043.1 hypothetical protein GLAREA_09206 [Glarea lozoyensis ATCC 20868]
MSSPSLPIHINAAGSIGVTNNTDDTIDEYIVGGYRLAEGDLTTFHYFQKLPTKLRLMIWKITCSNPRVIEVLHGKTKFENNPSNTPVPALLHVCREARAEGLKVYEKLPDCGDLHRYGTTYVNWEVDHILLEDCILDSQTHNPQHSLLHDDFQKCRHLVLGASRMKSFIFPQIGRNYYGIMTTAKKALKTIKIESLTVLMTRPKRTRNLVKRIKVDQRRSHTDPCQGLVLLHMLKEKFPDIEIRVGQLEGEARYRIRTARRTTPPQVRRHQFTKQTRYALRSSDKS